MIYKIQPIMLKLIREVIDDRKRNNIAPSYALDNEVLSKLLVLASQALDALENDNIIGSHPNINQRKLYYIIDKNGKDLMNSIKEKGGKL